MLSAMNYVREATGLHRAGRLREAEERYLQALALQPTNALALYFLGGLYVDTGKMAQGIALLRQAVAVKPDFADAYLSLGNALSAQGERTEAAEAYRQAVGRQPTLRAGQLRLGAILQAQGAFAEAERHFREAVALDPGDADAHDRLGGALFAQDQLEDALAAHRRAIALAPDSALFHSHLGNVLHASGRSEEALECHLRAVALDPNLPEAQSNLGIAWQTLDRWEQALACYRAALALRPDYAEVHFNLGIALLTLGDFAQGWPEFEWRLKTEPRASLPEPRWNGEPAPDKTLLVTVEQGLGDTLHFARYLPLVKARFQGRVVFECQPELVSLLAEIEGVDAITPRASGHSAPTFAFDGPISQPNSPSSFDFHVSLLSLPLLFGTTAETIPAVIPYLVAKGGGRQARQALRTEPRGLKVGLCWAGNPGHSKDGERSCALRQMAPLAQAAGAQFFSLQKGAAAEQASAPPEEMRLRDLAPELTDFRATARAILDLDLVISVDTSVAHLAGALGVPVWTALARNAEWRWLLEREDSPWYPTMRLFRQPAPGDWQSVFARMADALSLLTPR